jgi:PKD repeat protein
MKNLIISLFCFLLAHQSYCQLSGSYTIGGINPDYATITDAIDALSHSYTLGNVFFNIRPGLYEESIYMDANPFIFLPEHTVTFQSENLDSSSVEIMCDDCEHTIYNSSVSNLSFKHLTISVFGTTQAAMYFINTENISINNCIIYGLYLEGDSITVSNTKVVSGYPDFQSRFRVLNGLILENNMFYTRLRITYSHNSLLAGNWFDKKVDMGHSEQSQLINNILNDELEMNYSGYSNIINNTFNLSYTPGLSHHLYFSYKLNIIGNKFKGPTRVGYSDSSKVINNFFYDNLGLIFSNKSLIYSNNFSNNPLSQLDLSSNNSVVKNNCFSNEIDLWAQGCIIENNNYFPAGGFYDLAATHIDPQYESPDNIYTTNYQLINQGIFLTNVPVDIDSILRQIPPTMGANEICLSADTLDLVCGDSVVLALCNLPSGGNYLWTPSTGLNFTDIIRPKASPPTSTMYRVSESLSGFTDSIFVAVLPYQVDAYSDTFINCGDSINLFASYNAGATYEWTPPTGLNTPDAINTIAKPGETIVYTVTASINGCGVSYDTVHIIVDPHLRANISYIWHCDTAIFHNLTTCANEYYWDFGDGNFSYEFEPIHPYDTSGTYFITFIAYNEYGSDTISGNVDVGCAPSSIDNPSAEENKFKCYPNPVSGILTIETETAKGIYQLQDITGKLLLSGNVTATKFSLDISALSKGIYLLSLFDGEQQVNRKIVKE